MTAFAVGRIGRREETAPRHREIKAKLEDYRRPRWGAGLFQLSTTLALFAASWLAMWASLSGPYAITLLLALPTAGLLVRLFILQHDCGHGSLFASPRANRVAGVLLSTLTMTPFDCWKRQHALHHATNGQLDHRGMGDVLTLTVAEYRRLTRWGQWKYRAYRHPLFLFGLAPFLYFVVQQRFTWSLPRTWWRERRSIHATNLRLVVLVAALAYWIGPWNMMLIHLPVTLLAGACGVFLFYLQHQFNPTYWRHDADWEYSSAALDGSSYLELPGWLRWMTANIGYHHIHHLDSRIPNYALPECHRANPELQGVATLTLATCWRCARLKLWDEGAERLVTFVEAAHGGQSR